MPRSRVSEADEVLLQELHARGLKCSRYQLERWRQHGLLPRRIAVRLGAHGTRTEHAPEMTEVAALLATVAARGRSWQSLTTILITAGCFGLDEARVRDSFVWLVNTVETAEHRHIAAVIKDLGARSIRDRDPLEIGESVAALRGSRPDRRMLQSIGPVIAARYPDWGRRRINELARSGTVWTVAEVLGEELDVETKAVAQGWNDEADARAAGWTGPHSATRPTKAEMRTVGATVTLRELEAAQALAEVRLRTEESLAGVELHPYMLLRMIAQMRMVRGAGAERELSDDLLERMWADASTTGQED